MDIGTPRRRHRVRIPLLSVILSPGSRSDILRGKTRVATATSRINAYHGLRSLVHKPFAAECYCNTPRRALQDLFVKKIEFSKKNSLFCSKPFRGGIKTTGLAGGLSKPYKGIILAKPLKGPRMGLPTAFLSRGRPLKGPLFMPRYSCYP